MTKAWGYHSLEVVKQVPRTNDRSVADLVETAVLGPPGQAPVVPRGEHCHLAELLHDVHVGGAHPLGQEVTHMLQQRTGLEQEGQERHGDLAGCSETQGEMLQTAEMRSIAK